MAIIKTEQKIVDIDIIAIGTNPGQDDSIVGSLNAVITSSFNIDTEASAFNSWMPDKLGDILSVRVSGRLPDTGFDIETVGNNHCIGWPRFEITPKGKIWPKVCLVFAGYDAKEPHGFVCLSMVYDENGSFIGSAGMTWYGSAGKYARLTTLYSESEIGGISDSLHLVICSNLNFRPDEESNITNNSTISIPRDGSAFGIPFEVHNFEGPTELYIPNYYADGVGSNNYVVIEGDVRYGGLTSRKQTVRVSGKAIDDGDVAFWTTLTPGYIYFTEGHRSNRYSLTGTVTVDGVQLSSDFMFILKGEGGEGGEGGSDTGPYDPGGTSTGGGGGGSFDYPDPFDQIGETPVGSAEANSSSLGIFTRYLMSQSSLTRFGDYLYSDNLIDAVVMELMKLLYSTPAEALISLISYPFNVSSLLTSTPSNVFFGNGDTGIASDGRLTKTAAQINWGSILVKGWTGSFLDFSPHTKFDLYLPWCTGTVSLDPSEILTDRSTGISGDVATGQIQIRTNIEIAKGTCMHMVYNGDGVCLGTYSGVCGSQLPITALDTSGKALAFVTAAVSTIASGAAAAAGAAMGGMASSARTAGAFSPMSEASQLKQATLNGGHSPAVPNYSRGISGEQAVSRGAARVAVDSARAAAITPPSISRNGSFTANGSGMSIQYPYLIVSYPERDVPEKYSSHYGYPSNIYKQLGSLNGYTEVAAIHLDGISCTEPELSELDELLKGGVIL